MWATIKNYAILPQKNNGIGGGLGPMTQMEELPFCPTFTALDRKHVLSLHSNTPKNKMSNFIVARAALRKLVLCLTENLECFKFFQAQLRRRRVQTHLSVEQFLHHDKALLEDLVNMVMSKGVSLSKQQQLSHGIITQKAANAPHEGGQTGGMNLLNNLKGLIIQQDTEEDDDGAQNDTDLEEDGNEPANPYAFDDNSFPRNHRRFTLGNKPQYVVVSAPYQQEQNRRGKRGSITKLRIKNGATPGHLVDKNCSLEGSDDGKVIFGGNGRISRGGGNRSSFATATTARSSSTSIGFSTRDSLASAGEWFTSAILPVPCLRSQSQGGVEPIVGPLKGQMNRRATASLTSNSSQSGNWGQVNMSSRHMSENLQNSLQNVSRRDFQDFSERGTSATGGMAEFYGSSSEFNSSLMNSFGASQELPVLLEGVRSDSNPNQKKGGGLKAAFSFCRTGGRSRKSNDSVDSLAFEQSDGRISQDFQLQGSVNYFGSKCTAEDDEPHKSLAIESKNCALSNHFLAAAAAKAAAGDASSDEDSDDENASVLLVGFPARKNTSRDRTIIRRRDSSGCSSNVGMPTLIARGA